MITPYDIDIRWMTALNGDGGAVIDHIMWYASAKLTWIPLYAAVLWWVWRKHGVKVAVAFLITAALFVLCADQTASLFKANLPKLRPTHYPPLDGAIHTVNGYLGGMYGTVSSHAANCAGFALLSALVIRIRWVTVGLICWVLLVSYSRIYLGVHYPFDVLAGFIDGLFWGTVTYVLFKKIILKR